MHSILKRQHVARHTHIIMYIKNCVRKHECNTNTANSNNERRMRTTHLQRFPVIKNNKTRAPTSTIKTCQRREPHQWNRDLVWWFEWWCSARTQCHLIDWHALQSTFLWFVEYLKPDSFQTIWTQPSVSHFQYDDAYFIYCCPLRFEMYLNVSRTRV